jgi:hypothetical protein
MTASLPFQFDEQDIVQLRVNMKHLLIKLSKVYASWKTNEPVTIDYFSPNLRTEDGDYIDLITQKKKTPNDMKLPPKDIEGYQTEITASEDEQKKPPLHVEVSPNQMEVATQLVGLYCQPAAQTQS